VVRVIAAFMPLAGCIEEHDGSDLIANPPNYPPISPCDASSGGCMPPLEGLDAGASRDAALYRGDSGDNTCPRAQRPIAGHPCEVAAGKVCEYDYCDERPTIEASCKAGRWEVLVSSCNPPSVPCPDAEPSENEMCNRGWGPPTCAYGACDGGPATTYACENQHWKVTQRCSVMDACPAQQPADQSPCSYQGEQCGYGDCYGSPTSTADCVAGSWRVGHLSCNPPPPAACPALTPLEGASCQHVGASCWYELPTSVAQADCVNGSWRITTAAARDAE
jgi:hypothetical protein